jgi:hypothetical protein
MSLVKIQGNASGTGEFTIAAPNSNTNRTLTLPDNTGTILTTGGTIAASQLPAGSVLQVVQTVKLDAFTTSSGTPVDVTGLSVSITPSSASNKILVLGQIGGGSDATTGWYVNLVRGSTNLGVGTGGSLYNTTFSNFFSNANAWSGVPVIFLDSPNTTSSTTYKIQAFAGGGVGTVAINRRAGDAVIGFSSTITVMEIAA